MLTFRVGIPKTVGAIPGAVQRITPLTPSDSPACPGAPALISAMALWEHKPRTRIERLSDGGEIEVTDPGYFREVGSAVDNLDLALDSAGFVAMDRFGGYPWTVAQYVDLAGSWSWSWWAQMDLCCEPEIAADAAEVRRRQDTTAYLLQACRRRAAEHRRHGADWMTDPMPVLQGWHPDEYERSAQLADEALGGDWPPLVGIGSVCRRQEGGADGLWAVLAAAHRFLPPGVGVHLFGVKGSALQKLATHPRVTSADSQAWGVAARQRARKAGVSCSMAMKLEELDHWYGQQLQPTTTPQIRMFQ